MRLIRDAGDVPVARLDGHDGGRNRRTWDEAGDGDPARPLALVRPTESSAPSARPASNGDRTTWICLAGFLLLIALHATGLTGQAAYPVVTFSGAVCATIGIRRHRPAVQWPWWAMVIVGLLWTIGGIIGDLNNVTGDLTANRSLLPDLFSLPGYVLFGAALYGLLRSRQGNHERGVLLDGIMLGTGALLLVNELIIAPTMDIKGTWVMARIVVSLYPSISMGLLVIAARLVFSSGDKSPAFRLLLVGTLGLVIGDVVFALGEVGTFVFPQALLEVPYLLVPACISSAVLHPSIRFLTRNTQRRRATLGRSRLIAVAGALLAPIVVIATSTTSRSGAIETVLCLVLAVAAIARLSSAIKEQAAFEARLSHQATHDELTGLPSRVLILEHIEEMLTSAETSGDSVAVMFIDLDQFKLINDSMGHGIGDQLLMVAAQRIASSVTRTDVVGRISGDEFIVVGLHDQHAALSLGERIRRILGDGFYLDAGEVFVSVSIGVTIATPSDKALAATLIQEADTAMYRSKDAGRNRVTIFDSSMREKVARRVDLERRLRHALTERHFAAFYQPLVSLPNGQVYGFEALARWKEGGQMISPAEFIPVAEESGLIVQLGAFMLDEACRQIAKWRRTIPGGQGLYVSVNLSTRQMRESDIVDTVADALDRYNLPGDALWLEITESVMMEDSVATAGVMSGLRMLGVRLAVDDFGTGFSSLSYLKRYPVSCVKIDRSFVSGLGFHESDSSLVAAIIAMGSALDLEPVAEGVETSDQAQRLFALGCRQAQGYLFGKAVPADEVPAAIRRLGLVGAPRVTPTRRCTTSTHRN